jgi:hypothetical protein
MTSRTRRERFSSKAFVFIASPRDAGFVSGTILGVTGAPRSLLMFGYSVVPMICLQIA